MTKEQEVEEFIGKNGGYWGPGHPSFPPKDWIHEVKDENTRCGYWEWVWKQVYGE